MQQTYLHILIKFSLLFLITIQADAKHNFSNADVIDNDYMLIIRNEMNDTEVVLTDGILVEGNLSKQNKYISGSISIIDKKTIEINGERIDISQIRRIRTQRTRGNRILKIFGIVSTLIGILAAALGLSGAILFVGLIVLGLVIAFQSNYINLENPDVKTEVKEL